MYDHWDLSALYNGCNDKKYAEDVARVGDFCAGIQKLASEAGKIPDAEFVKKYILFEEGASVTFDRLASYLSLRSAVNSKDNESVSELSKLMTAVSAVSGYEAGIKRYIGSIPDLDGIIASDPILTEYAYLLRSIKDEAAHLLGNGEEKIISLFNISGGHAWSDLQSYLTSSVAVDYNGGVTNLSDIRNNAYDVDPEVRKKSYDAELACYDKIKDSVAFSMNSIKMQAMTEASLRGFESPLDATLFQSKIKKETLDALTGAMEEYMPHFRRYLKAKAKLLGHKNGLPWYDLFAPVGNSGKTFTPETAREYLGKVFGGFDAELADMIDGAFEHDWIDFYPADGKVGGAFCSSVSSEKRSYVLTNFGGYFTDVMTLAHELGHAFHNKMIYGSHRPLNGNYSMPVAETASNFNEVVTMDYALTHAESDGEKLSLIESKLSDTTQIICDCYSRFLFEKSVFESRGGEFLSADRLCELMLAAQDKTYGDGLDGNFKHPYMWLCKSHYYSAGLSFYNWPYSFGGLFAQGLYAKYKKEGKSFIPLYKKLLYSTTVCSVEDAAAIADIDVTDKQFWRDGLDYFVSMIDDFEKLVDKEVTK